MPSEYTLCPHPPRPHCIVTRHKSLQSRETIFIYPSHFSSTSLCCSFFCQTVPRLRPQCFLFTNKSPLCNFCLYIQTHRNNNTVVFMTLRGRQETKTTFEEEEGGLVVWCHSPVHTYHLKKNNFLHWMFCPLDHVVKDGM